MSSKKIISQIVATAGAAALFFVVTFAVRAKQAAAPAPQVAPQVQPAPQIRPATPDLPESLAGRGRPQSIENGVHAGTRADRRA